MAVVVVSGALANKCRNGGEAWVRLSWLLGFRKLGCRVYFLEQIDPANCINAAGQATDFAKSVNVTYFQEITERFGLSDCASLICGDGERTAGLAWSELPELAESADLLVNISGHLHAEELLRRFRRKAYVDIDPGFTQFWHAAANPGARLAGHDCYF